MAAVQQAAKALEGLSVAVGLRAADEGADEGGGRAWDVIAAACLAELARRAAAPAAFGPNAPEREIAALTEIRDAPLVLLGPVTALVSRAQAASQGRAAQAAADDDDREAESGVAEARRAVRCWIDVTAATAVLVGLPDDLRPPDQQQHSGSRQPTRRDDVLALPFADALRDVAERATFHFPAWHLVDSAAAGGGSSDAAATKDAAAAKRKGAPSSSASTPGYFLDYVAERGAAVHGLVSDLLRDVSRPRVADSVLATVDGQLRRVVEAIFAERFIAPAVERACQADSAPLLHLATVLGAFSAQPWPFPAPQGPEPALPPPCVGLLATQLDVLAAWLQAERQYLTAALELMSIGSADATAACGAPSWRRARLAETLSEFGIGEPALGSAALPYSSHLPQCLRAVPVGLRASAQRAAPLLTAAVLRQAAGGIAGGDPWAMYGQRIVCFVIDAWRLTIAERSERLSAADAEPMALMRYVIAPATYLNDSVALVLAELGRAGAPSGALSAAQDAVDQLALLRDAAVRSVVARLSIGASHAAAALAPYCPPDVWLILLHHRGGGTEAAKLPDAAEDDDVDVR